MAFPQFVIDVIFLYFTEKMAKTIYHSGIIPIKRYSFCRMRYLASAVCMDKAVTNILLEAAGIDQANFMWFYASDYENVKEQVKEDIMADLGGYPVFVKPANAGSSVGVSKAKKCCGTGQSCSRCSKRR